MALFKKSKSAIKKNKSFSVKSILIFVALFGVIGILAQTIVKGEAQPADILMVKLDDLSIDAGPYYMPETYNLVKGEHWYTFNQVVAPTPLCGPERMSFLTGQTVDHHGYTCHTSGTMCPSWIANKNKTITKSLDNAGYYVGWYGKQLNSSYVCKGDLKKDGGGLYPNPPGIDDAKILGPGDKKTLFKTYDLVENGTKFSYSTKSHGDAHYGTYVTADDTLQGIANCPEDTPCFLTWNPMAPHQPGTPAADFKASKVVPGMTEYQPPNNEGCPKAVDKDITDKPYLLQTQTKCASGKGIKRSKFQQSLQAVDNRLPAIINAFLAREPNRPKRIIITSDHGQELGNHRHQAKEVPYEMSLRVPLFIYDSDAPGGTVDKLVNNLNLNATIHEWAHSVPLLPNDGQSLVPLYKDNTNDWPTQTYSSQLKVQNGTKDVSPWHAIRQDCTRTTDQDGDGDTDCFKLVKYPAQGSIGLQYELYDLTEDPWELTNLLPNSVTGYPGQSGWTLSSSAVAPLVTSLNNHIAAGK